MKRLVTSLFIVAFLGAAINVHGQSKNENSNIVEQERKVADFNKLSVSHGIDIEITQGQNNSVVVVADKDLQEKIITEVEGDELKIYVDGNIYKTKKMLAVVTVKQLDAIKASSGSDVETKNTLMCKDLTVRCKSGSDIELSIEASSLKCHLSSGSDAEIIGKISGDVNILAEHGSDVEGKFSAQHVFCDVNHGSDLDLKGKAKSLNIDASGGSDVSASDFIVEDCKLEASGGSDAEVYASNSIVIDASSASDVYYYGSPKQRDINASSSADVHKR